MKVVTICGSMRFEEQMKKIAFDLETKSDMCVLQCVYNVDKDTVTDDDIAALNKTHLKKIEISDAIYVVDIDGYIGEQVKKEIEYAKSLGKKVIYHSKMLGHKIILVGCPGSGKSTLSDKLQKSTGFPLFHLDGIWWKPDRTHISRDEFDSKLDEIFQGEDWIIDGDFSRTYEVRIKECDTVIFLDYSLDECMGGISERVGKKRDDIPWTDQSLDPLLVKQVEDYESENKPVLYSLIEKYSDKRVMIFKSRSEADEWLDSIS